MKAMPKLVRKHNETIIPGESCDEKVTLQTVDGIKVVAEQYQDRNWSAYGSVQVHLNKPSSAIWVGFPKGSALAGVTVYADGRIQMELDKNQQ